MEYKVQVGKVAFAIETPVSYQWQPTDEGFLHWNGQATRTVGVSIRDVKMLPIISGDPIYQDEGRKYWQREDMELRCYQAPFSSGRPVYAHSRWKKERVDIEFDFGLNIWKELNMQLWNLLHLENQLLLTDAVILHCCYTQHQGGAILFTAPSGTGKTTQGELWKRVYQSEIINGDRGLLQREKTGWNVCGFPIHGSAQECENRSYPIRAIVVVRQDPADWVEELSPTQKLGLLYNECTVNSWDEKKVQKVLNLLADLIVNVPVVMLHCTMRESAAHVLHRYLYGE